MRIGMGSAVSLHYTLAFRDGTIVSSSFGDEPLTITVGEGVLDPVLELALVGLKAGQSQTLTLLPGQAFGERDPAAEHWMPRTAFPDAMDLGVGTVLEFVGPDERPIAGTLKALESDRVLVDFNHPLAGHEVRFSVEILSVGAPSAD